MVSQAVNYQTTHELSIRRDCKLHIVFDQLTILKVIDSFLQICNIEEYYILMIVSEDKILQNV